MPVFNMLDFSNNNCGSVNYWFELFKVILTSWPLFFIIIILLFKSQFTELLEAVIFKIKSITSIKYKEWEAIIDKTIKNRKHMENKLELEDEYEEMPGTMKFVFSWMKFESNIRGKYGYFNNDNKLIPIMKLLKQFVNKAITKDEYFVLGRINNYRNLLLHENYTDLPISENYKFIEFLAVITDKIDKFYQQEKGNNNAD